MIISLRKNHVHTGVLAIDKPIPSIQLNILIHVISFRLFGFVILKRRLILASQDKGASNQRLTAIEKSEPYRFFLSTVHGISEQSNQINVISLKGMVHLFRS